MQRRQFIAGFSTLVAGSGAALGTGAFTNVTANRTVNVTVADESSAYLGLAQGPEPNGDFANEASANGEISIDFNDSIVSTPAGSGTGVGQDSTYEFDAVFEITNQGTQEIFVQIDDVTYSGGFGSDGVTLEFYVNDGGSRERIDGSNASLNLGTGSMAEIGVRIKTDEPSLNEYNGKETTITAQASNFGTGNQITP